MIHFQGCNHEKSSCELDEAHNEEAKKILSFMSLRYRPYTTLSLLRVRGGVIIRTNFAYLGNLSTFVLNLLLQVSIRGEGV